MCAIIPIQSLRNSWFYKLYILQACYIRVKSNRLLIYQSQASHDIDIASCRSCVHSCLSLRFQQLLIWITSLSCKNKDTGTITQSDQKSFHNDPHYFRIENPFSLSTLPVSLNRSITASKYLKCVQRLSWSSHCFRQKEKDKNCRKWLHFIRGDKLCTVF